MQWRVICESSWRALWPLMLRLKHVDRAECRKRTGTCAPPCSRKLTLKFSCPKTRLQEAAVRELPRAPVLLICEYRRDSSKSPIELSLGVGVVLVIIVGSLSPYPLVSSLNPARCPMFRVRWVFQSLPLRSGVARFHSPRHGAERRR